MKRNKLISSVIATLLLATLLCGCGNGASAAKDSGKSKKYIIACDSKYAPFSFEKDGTYKGIDVEVLDAIAKEEKIDYQLKPMDFDAIIPALKSNQIDGAIAGMSMTEERKQALDFSDGYFKSGLSIVVNADNKTIKGASDLKGKSVAVKKGTAGAKFAEDNTNKYGLKLNYLQDSPTMFLDVENKHSDFSLEDYPVIAYKIKIDGSSKLRIAGDKLTSVDYGFAVNKGKNADLLKKFNEGLKKIKQNGKYDKIVNQYIGK